MVHNPNVMAVGDVRELRRLGTLQSVNRQSKREALRDLYLQRDMLQEQLAHLRAWAVILRQEGLTADEKCVS